MAFDKVVDSAFLEAGLKKVGDSIRAKAGTIELLEFPDAMSAAVDAINTSKPEQTKTATPSLSQQTIVPDSGKVLSGVTINPITAALLASLDPDFKEANIAEGVNMFGRIGTHKSGTPVAYGRISGSSSNDTLSITGLDFAPTRFYAITTGSGDTYSVGYSYVIKNGGSLAHTLGTVILTVTPTFSSNGVTIKVSKPYMSPHWGNTYEWVAVG